MSNNIFIFIFLNNLTFYYNKILLSFIIVIYFYLYFYNYIYISIINNLKIKIISTIFKLLFNLITYNNCKDNTKYII